MSMLHYPLYDFLATVPICLETTTLAVVLEIFDQQQCDRLVVVNQQQCPVGLLYSARLSQKLLAVASDDQFLNLQQQLSTLGQTLIEPIQTLPAADRLERFSLLLSEQRTYVNNNLDWALIDINGKFLGLLDSKRILRLLAQEKAVNSAAGTVYSTANRSFKNGSQEYKYVNPADNSNVGVKSHWRSPRDNSPQPSVHKLAIAQG